MSDTNNRSLALCDIQNLVYRYVPSTMHLLFHPSQIPLFQEAFTHKSLRGGPTYERLEFLGDAISSAALSGYIFRRFASQDEAFMSRLRAHLISGKVYAEVSKHAGLPGYIRLSQETAHLRLRPDVQEDVYEAFIGAIYLAFGYAVAETWVVHTIEEHVDISSIVRGAINPRERLTNLCITLFKQRPDISVDRDGGTHRAKVLHPETGALVAEAHSDTSSRAIMHASDLAFGILSCFYPRLAALPAPVDCCPHHPELHAGPEAPSPEGDTSPHQAVCTETAPRRGGVQSFQSHLPQA